MDMIHTAQFYILLEDVEVSTLCRKFSQDVALLPHTIDAKFDGIKTVFRKYGSYWWMFVYIDFIKLLGKSDICEADLGEIRQKMNLYLYELFGTNDKEFTLIRIDYRFDAFVPNDEHRKLLFKLYKKTAEQYGFKRKNAHFSSTIYFNSNSMRVICYDKEEERNAKVQEIQSYECNILRFEVSLLNRHLNYMKKAYGIEKRLENYMSKKFWLKYIKGNICPIFFPGNYYRITTATVLIQKSKLKERDKKSLRQFLCDVSKYGISGIEQLEVKDENGCKKSKYSAYLIRKYIKLLAMLNINPLLIPKNEPIKLGKDKYIKNPIQPLL